MAHIGQKLAFSHVRRFGGIARLNDLSQGAFLVFDIRIRAVPLDDLIALVADRPCPGKIPAILSAPVFDALFDFVVLAGFYRLAPDIHRT